MTRIHDSSTATSTKLSILCERLIEAGWLVALMVTPLFFNVYSSRVFEPDKLTILRSVALIMVLAWVLKGLETWRAGAGTQGQKPPAASGPSRRRSSLRSRLTVHPLPLLALLAWAVYAFSTVVSVVPHLSLWGSYVRLQGLYTTSAYVVVFLSIVALLRTREQIERLLTMVLIVSLPVSLYGIIQHFGTDPVPWGSDVSRRVASTMGNPIFVAAFLIMVVPLTLYRLLESARGVIEREGVGLKVVLVIGSLLSLILHMAAWWLGPTTGSLAAVTIVGMWIVEALLLGKPLLPFVRVSSYSVLLSTQLTCIFLTQSRGPWLGLVAGLFCFALLWTCARGKWRWTSLLAGLSVVVVLALVVMNLPNSPVSFVRHIPYVSRLSQVFTSGTSRVRILIWQGAGQLIAADPLRAVIGYGPETMLVAYPPYYPPELGQVERRTALPDRSHNETLDTLVTTGLIGLTISLVFVTGLIYRGVQYLGLLRSPRQRHVFLGLWIMGGIGAVLVSRLLDHSWRFFGVALPLGMLGGLFVYLSAYGLHGLLGNSKPRPGPTGLSLHLFVATLLAAVVAYFVEIQVGIAIAATRTYFWAYAALLLVAGHVYHGRSEEAAEIVAVAQAGSKSEQAPAAAKGRRGRRQGRRRQHRPVTPAPRPEVIRSGYSREVIAASLLVCGIILTMGSDFLSLQIARAHLWSVLWLFAFTWAFGGLIILTETWSAEGSVPQHLLRLGGFGVYAGLTLLGALLVVIVYRGPLRLVLDPVNPLVPYYTAMFLILVATGGVLLLGERLPGRTLTGVVGLIAPGLAVGTFFLVAANLDVVRADIYYKQAKVRFHEKRKYDQAIALYRRALELQPGQDFYYLFLGKALLEKGQHTKRIQEREALFQEAEKSLMTARNLIPLHPDHTANLARLYQSWARRTTDSAQRTARLRHALSFYAQTIARSPYNILLWNEWGKTYALMGDHAQAREKYQHALSLDDSFAPTYLYLGDLYRAQSKWKEAAQAYEHAVARQPDSVQGHSALGTMYAKMGRMAEALRENHRVLALAPNDLVTHRNLAMLYRAMGKVPRALEHAQRALELAPPKERAALEKLIAQLRQQRTSRGQ
jgi:tetratricopeptide (TPR) repeat protein/O-antigen ligase